MAMLGRTANGLFWMFRYIERAENTARLIDAGVRMSLTSTSGPDDEWSSVLKSAGVEQAYLSLYDRITGPDAIDFLLRDRNNPSSVMAAIDAARNNARMVRTALTREAWESTNECWIELKTRLARRVRDTDLPAVLDLIKQRTGLMRGAFHGTMLRNDIFNFSRIGTFIERADNTARILDVKYYLLLPAVTYVGSSLDNVQWVSILRSVSAHRAYGWVYGSELSPVNIADFLIVNGQMPRSLAYCHAKISNNLAYLADQYSQRHPAQDTAEEILASLRERDIGSIIDRGLHEFIQDFINRNNRLSHEIAEAYRFY